MNKFVITPKDDDKSLTVTVRVRKSLAIVYSIIMAVIASYTIKVFSACLEKIVYQVRKKICAKK